MLFLFKQHRKQYKHLLSTHPLAGHVLCDYWKDIVTLCVVVNLMLTFIRYLVCKLMLWWMVIVSNTALATVILVSKELRHWVKFSNVLPNFKPLSRLCNVVLTLLLMKSVDCVYVILYFCHFTTLHIVGSARVVLWSKPLSCSCGHKAVRMNKYDSFVTIVSTSPFLPHYVL